jgi:phage tail-like protein
MGILLTTVTKQTPPDDPFAAGKFSSSTMVGPDPKIYEEKLVPYGDIPYSTYLCAVMIENKIVGLFQSISDITIERNVDQHSQGGENECSLELPGGISYGHVTLNSGFSTSDLFIKWILAGSYDAHPIYKNFEVRIGRPSQVKTGVEMTRVLKFTRAFPVKWKISDLSVDETEKIVIETVELSFKEFEVDYDKAAEK